MERNRRLISVYGISHYWLIVVYRSHTGSSLAQEKYTDFFNTAKIRLEIHVLVCIHHALPSLECFFKRLEASSMDKTAPLFPQDTHYPK